MYVLTPRVMPEPRWPGNIGTRITSTTSTVTKVTAGETPLIARGKIKKHTNETLVFVFVCQPIDKPKLELTLSVLDQGEA